MTWEEFYEQLEKARREDPRPIVGVRLWYKDRDALLDEIKRTAVIIDGDGAWSVPTLCGIPMFLGTTEGVVEFLRPSA